MRDFIARRNLVLAIVLVGGLALFGVVHITAHALPFTPYRVNFYSAVPDSGCPNTEVEIHVNYNLNIPRYMSVKPIVPVSSVWVNAEGQEVEAGGGDIDLSTLEQGRGLDYVSPILRKAPDTPGVWQLVSEVKITGEVLTAKREHFFVTPSRDVFRVLAPDAPACTV